MIAWFIALVFSAAAAPDEVPWYVGLPVAQVSLEGVRGGLPTDNLEPLLRTRQGEVLNPGLVRADVHLLVRAGEFASVEVIVEPWFITYDNGESGAAVRVIYRVQPSPRISQIEVEGSKGASKKVVESALDLQLGAPFFPAEDVAGLRQRVEGALRGAGWPEAQAEVRVRQESESQLGVVVSVVLGPTRTVGEVRIGGESVVSDKRVKGWLRRSGVASGRRLSDAVMDEARGSLLSRLESMGWVDARVNIIAGPELPTDLSVLIAAGHRVRLRPVGRGLPRRDALREVLGLRSGTRLASRTLEDAAERVEDWFGERGFRDATVEIRAQEVVDGTRLVVHADRGSRHKVQRIRVSGASRFTPSAMRAATRDADPDGYGRGLVVDGGDARVQQALTELYRGAGYLSADIQVENQREERAGFVGLPLRFGLANTVAVTLAEGPRTQLDTLILQGGGDEVRAAFEEGRVALESAALNPAALDTLLEDLITISRDEGYLDTKGSMSIEVSADSASAAAGIMLDPGYRVLLRSIVIRGNRRTRRHVIAREVALEVGEPVTPRRVDQTRSALYDLDLFRYVRPELVGEDPRSRDLLLQVEERKNVVLEAGGGVSTDEGLLARGRVTHRNIAGLGQRLSILGQVGYGWIGDEWTLDTAVPVWRAATRYELPYVPGRGHRLVLEGLLQETVQEPNWRMSRSGGSASLKMRLSQSAELVFDYKLQVRRLEDVDPGALVKGDPWVPLLGLESDLSGEVLAAQSSRFFSGGSILVYTDGRDDRFSPRQGTTTSTRMELGDGAFSGLATVKGSTRVERLIPLGPLVLDLVGAGGIGWAEGRAVTLPLEDRFYLGGGRTLRGFRLNSVGPANLTSRPEVPFPSQVEPVVDGITLRDTPAQWVATGGDAYAAVTVEVWIPLPILGLRQLDSTSLVLFTDMGHVGFMNPAIVTTSRLLDADPPVRTSFGAGFRVATPIGPASFDLGFNPNPLLERDEPWVLPHLSLGVL